jgi:hypothetical protein
VRLRSPLCSSRRNVGRDFSGLVTSHTVAPVTREPKLVTWRSGTRARMVNTIRGRGSVAS